MKKLLVTITVVMLAGMLQAELLEHYKFTSPNYGRPQYSSTTVNTTWFIREPSGHALFTTNLTRTSTAGTFTALGASGAGNTPQSAVDGFYANLGNAGWGVAADLGAQPTTPRYGYFTMTVQNLGAGQTLDISGVELDWNIFNVRDNTDYYTRMYVDVNGSTANFNNGTDFWREFLDNPTTGAGTGWNTTNVNVSSIARIQGLENGDVLEFRIYSSSIGDNRGDYLFDDVKIHGTVIPEPATIGLVGLAGAFALFVRRFST